MRDCKFLLADNRMAIVLEAFLSRPDAHKLLKTAPFQYSAKEDLLICPWKDSGVYHQSSELLRPYLRSHAHALIVQDAEWAGSPGAEEINQHISEQMIANGWEKGRFEVVVIDPELEIWMWQDHPKVAEAFGYDKEKPFRPWLAEKGLWPENSAKPGRPKEAVEEVVKTLGKPKIAKTVYKKICSSVPIKACVDSSFLKFVQTLCGWFPQKKCK